MAEPPQLIAPDDDLLPRVAAGDELAFTALYRRYSGEIFRFALHMTGSRSAADDVTQDVFLAVMRDADRYIAGVSSEIAWLRGIARNHVRRRLDRERATAPLPVDGEEGCPCAAGEAPIGELVRAERIEAIRRAVFSLPVRYREVVVLCDLEELSYADAAAAVGVAVGTVRSRLSRGRALLASKLGAAKAREACEAGDGDEGAPQARWAI